MKNLIPILLLIAAIQVHATFRPQVIEIDGERLPVRESMDLIFGRNSAPLINNFKTVKLNGKEMDPFLLKSGTVYLRTEEGDGDSSSYEAKLKSNKKTALTCNGASAAAPSEIEIKRTVTLVSGQAVFLMTYDQEFQREGKTVTLFICN